ncbi:MAG: hypothetical protein KC593_10995 [Myxococcales bacterium]|nr:hypothetical protein [Myxococcales bacterium]MCB9626316.1 hypothetical protein [Sandaracinaceae bacterium]
MSRPPGVLLPVLQELDWSGQSLAVVRPLATFEAERMPWVSYAYTGHQRRYTVTPTALEEEGRSQEALEWEALAQLRRRPLSWEVKARRADGWPHALTLVDEFASSAVLSPERLREAHERLTSDRAWLAIPTQGVLVLRARDADEEQALRDARELEAWARDAFSRALDTRVTPTLFAVEQGVLTGALEPAATDSDGPRLLPEGYEPEEERMTFRYVGEGRELRGSDLATAVEIERRGRLAPGQPVDEVWVLFDSESDAAVFAPRVRELQLVPAVERDGRRSEWEPEHE